MTYNHVSRDQSYEYRMGRRVAILLALTFVVFMLVITSCQSKPECPPGMLWDAGHEPTWCAVTPCKTDCGR